MALNINRAGLALCIGNARQFPRDPRPQIALSGRSNVGKSSLINTLLCRKSLARVSGTPGKTVTVNFYNVDDKLYLVDLPGYGYAHRSRESQKSWSALTEDYFVKNPSADAVRLVLQLIDLRVGPTEDDVLMMNYMTEQGVPFSVVATKADKLSPTAARAAVEELKNGVFRDTGIDVLPFSSVTGQGRDTVWRLMREAAGLPE